MIAINSNNKFSVVTVEKWEDYQSQETKIDNKVTTEEQQSNTNKNVKNIYIILLKEYASKIKGNGFNNKIKMIGELKDRKEYNDLITEEQDQLFNELMNLS